MYYGWMVEKNKFIAFLKNEKKNVLNFLYAYNTYTCLWLLKLTYALNNESI